MVARLATCLMKKDVLEQIVMGCSRLLVSGSGLSELRGRRLLLESESESDLGSDLGSSHAWSSTRWRAFEVGVCIVQVGVPVTC